MLKAAFRYLSKEELAALSTEALTDYLHAAREHLATASALWRVKLQNLPAHGDTTEQHLDAPDQPEPGRSP
jgi:hypothetical protein